MFLQKKYKNDVIAVFNIKPVRPLRNFHYFVFIPKHCLPERLANWLQLFKKKKNQKMSEVSKVMIWQRGFTPTSWQQLRKWIWSHLHWKQSLQQEVGRSHHCPCCGLLGWVVSLKITPTFLPKKDFYHEYHTSVTMDMCRLVRSMN